MKSKWFMNVRISSAFSSECIKCKIPDQSIDFTKNDRELAIHKWIKIKQMSIPHFCFLNVPCSMFHTFGLQSLKKRSLKSNTISGIWNSNNITWLWNEQLWVFTEILIVKLLNLEMSIYVHKKTHTLNVRFYGNKIISVRACHKFLNHH